MPIHPPGQRFRYHRILGKMQNKRPVAAVLSLTAMVDMFTVLVIFLLQNFDPQTNAVMYIAENVDLPSAEKVKDLRPAVVITISDKELLINKKSIADLGSIKAQEDWMLKGLFSEMQLALQQAREKEEQELRNQIKSAIMGNSAATAPSVPKWSKVTIQADRQIDFLTVKKVMYTVTEAGAGEINFAVTREASSN